MLNSPFFRLQNVTWVCHALQCHISRLMFSSFGNVFCLYDIIMQIFSVMVISSATSDFTWLQLCIVHFVVLDEWENFLERIKSTADAVEDVDSLELRFWASYRGQTLARTGSSVSKMDINCDFVLLFLTWLSKIPIYNHVPFYGFLIFCSSIWFFIMWFAVRGMMYYRRALLLQSYLEKRYRGGILFFFFNLFFNESFKSKFFFSLTLQCIRRNWRWLFC